jgi:CRISPR/Cas system CMR-associated protein Cmr5 small subunit
VLKEDILAKIDEIKLLAEALANAHDEERAHRQRDAEFSTVEGKLREAITYNKQLKATMASLKRKAREVQAAAHVAGLKQRHAAVELHEELDVAMGQKCLAKKERRFALQKVFTNSTSTRVTRDISGMLNECKPLASSVTEGERLQAFVAGRLQKRFGDKGKPPKPRTQPTQAQQLRQQSAQPEQHE